MGDLMEALFKNLFGYHRYRIKFIYKDKAGRAVFHLTRTVGVKKKQTIEEHRGLKVEFGPMSSTPGIPKSRLCNGTIDVEPICYLGRW